MNTGFQLSNVISGNGGNGIGIYGASGNTIAMNNIGTDSSGTLKRGNAKNGIMVTDGASGEYHRRPGNRRQRSHGDGRDCSPAAGKPDLGQSWQRRADHRQSDPELAVREFCGNYRHRATRPWAIARTAWRS